MQKTGHSISSRRDCDETKSTSAALALACEWLALGNMVEAAKWAAIAANLGEAEKLTITV